MAKDNIQHELIDDWDNLRYKINRYFTFWPDYIFRGQTQDDWLLESTLTRALKAIKQEDKLSLVEDHLNRFKLDIRGKRGNTPRNLDENELWALGQHYGLFTPLLDWSESPWIALFFALVDAKESETGFRTLWALNKYDLETISDSYSENEENKKSRIEIVEPFIDENYRLLSQKGLFTKIGIEDNLENWVEEAQSPGEWITLYKFTFPDKLRHKILRYLNLMNINHSSLFPDLYGSSLNTNIRLLETDFITEYQIKDRNDEIDDDE